MNDFYVSDLLVQDIPESKYYWQNLLMRCAVGVKDSDSMTDNPDKPVSLYFYQVNPNAHIFLTNPTNLEDTLIEVSEDSSGTEIFKSEVLFERKGGKVCRPSHAGKILNHIFDLIDNKSWSFPRAETDRVYIPRRQCQCMELTMQDWIVEYERSAQESGKSYVVLTVDKAGTLLAKRLGLDIDGSVSIQHYNSNNTQDDGLIKDITVDLSVDEDLISHNEIIVIDDLISSGRTAKSVSEFLIQSGARKVTWVALYRTVSSVEVELDNTDKINYKSFFPLSNAFWVWGRGFDLSTEESREKSDIYASQKFWDDESEEDVCELIRFFNGNSDPKKYLTALIPR